MMSRSTLPMTFRAAALAVAASMATGAWADDDVGELRDGKWVQWIYSIPASVNPNTDTTGQHCMVGQSGSTWYLAPHAGGGTVSRTCTIPQGVKLQFAVAGSNYVYAPGFCGDVSGVSDAELRAIIAGVTDKLSVNVTLDGERVKARRVRSEVFATALPTENLFAPVCGSSPVPAGIYRTVDDTYYAEIDKLRPGVHTLQMTATNGTTFNQNVVYTLTVVPKLRH
ncbi:hypothetical protein [Ideonella sp. BN130291]|uniref:hypothetical protein n=1 Tax=Ideonella sp. BN130291 TaxID=3112940 RepID=UPI002E26AD60|nr:hypothetical protein [Ideonella sp. BN130291]